MWRISLVKKIERVKIKLDIELLEEKINLIKDEESFNQLNYEVWVNHLEEKGHPIPGFIEKFKSGSLLILGGNPSFNSSRYTKEISECEDKDILYLLDPNNFDIFTKEKTETEKEIKKHIKDAIKLDNCIWEGGHRYRKALENAILNPLKLTKDDVVLWDVFSLRINKQNDLDSFFKLNPKMKIYQLLMLLRVIEICKPKMIVLANCGAANKLLSYSKSNVHLSIIFDEENGTHQFSYKDFKCPMFISANLSSRNSLDRFSKERLGWHLKRVWNEIHQKELQIQS